MEQLHYVITLFIKWKEVFSQLHNRKTALQKKAAPSPLKAVTGGQRGCPNKSFKLFGQPLCLKFTFLDGLFDGFLDQLGIPVVVEGLFGPDHRLNLGFQLVMTGFTEIPVSHMEVIPVGNRQFNLAAANITNKASHIKLLLT
jgi:hypothetical protein